MRYAMRTKTRIDSQGTCGKRSAENHMLRQLPRVHFPLVYRTIGFYSLCAVRENTYLQDSGGSSITTSHWESWKWIPTLLSTRSPKSLEMRPWNRSSNLILSWAYLDCWSWLGYNLFWEYILFLQIGTGSFPLPPLVCTALLQNITQQHADHTVPRRAGITAQVSGFHDHTQITVCIPKCFPLPTR